MYTDPLTGVETSVDPAELAHLSPAEAKAYVAHFAADGAGARDGGHDDHDDRIVNPSPADSPIWQSLQRYRGPVRTNGLAGSKRRFYKWDYLHNEIEVLTRTMCTWEHWVP